MWQALEVRFLGWLYMGAEGVLLGIVRDQDAVIHPTTHNPPAPKVSSAGIREPCAAVGTGTGQTPGDLLGWGLARPSTALELRI
jgi:hypothetical protein